MKMNAINQKEAHTKVTKGLLDMIVLQYLNKEDMHGYQLISSIRKGFGIYFGPSTIYPLLGQLEKKGHVKSSWNMNSERPRKVYTLTTEGKNLLKVAEDALAMIVQKISPEITFKVQTPALVIA